MCGNGPVSLGSGRGIPEELPGQFEVALVQRAVFDGVQQGITQRHRRFVKRWMIAGTYVHGLIQPVVGKRGQQFLHSGQPALVACH